MRGGVRWVSRRGARGRRGRVRVRWEGGTRLSATWERIGSEEILENGKVGHGCVHHLREPVVGELGGDQVPTPELVFA